MIRGLGLPFILLAVALPPSAKAVAQDAVLDDLRVSLITMGPGAAVWERFGHNAIRVTDPARGIDLAYNYGLFDFQQEGFLVRFLQGKMRYWMAAADGQRTIEAYRRADRSVWVQELNLTAAQRAELYRFLEWNRQPEHKFYDYNYYRDNCSTRVRDVLDRILGGTAQAQLASTGTGVTLRDHTRRLLQEDVLSYTGIMLGLGQPVDRPITEWEAGFLPVQLQRSLRGVRIPGGERGEREPLVASEQRVYESTMFPEPDALPRYWPAFLLLGLLMGGALALTGRTAPRPAPRQGTTRHAFLGLAAAWSLVAGVIGTGLAALWWLTDHVTSARNENLFQASPLSLVMFVLVVGLFITSSPTWKRLSLWVAAGAAALSVVGLAAKLLPAMYQVNGEIIALFLPAHLGLLYGMWRGSRPTRAGAVVG